MAAFPQTVEQLELRLLLVTHYYGEHRGGVEIVAGELAARLARHGLEITWAASGPTPHESISGVSYLPMAACNLSERLLGLPYPVWGPLSLRCLAAAVRRCDVVHLHDSLYLGSFAAARLASWYGKPVIVTQHVGKIPYNNRITRGILEIANRTIARHVLANSTQAVFISAKVQNYFARFTRFSAPPRFLPNGVDTRLFHPLLENERGELRSELGWHDDKLHLLFVGRFVEKKGLRWLKMLADRFRDHHWTLIGWGPEEPNAWDLPNVSVLGPMAHDATAQYFQAADLLVLPSVGEGFPLVVQEAMACGTPALISNDTAAGIPGIEQYCFTADLSTEALTSCFERIVTERSQLATRRQRVADYARQNWDWQHCADFYAELCQDLGDR